jgi:flagellar biogenesis protein FliO
MAGPSRELFAPTPAQEIHMFIGGGLLGTILLVVIIVFIVRRL